MRTYHSYSSKATQEFGARLARELKSTKRRRPRGAAVFALKGDLGAGKTTFVQGFFVGFGLRKRAPSPTFIIMRRHTLRGTGGPGGFSNVFHVDAYRLKDARALEALDFEKVLAGPRNVVLIEWADRARGILPKDARWIEFRHGKNRDERRIIMKR